MNKKKKAINQSNTRDTAPTSVAAFYRNMYTYTQMPISKDIIEKLALEYVNFTLSNPKVLKPSEFYTHKGMLRQSFENLRGNHPVLEEAHEFVKMIIGDRRETGALEKRLDAGIVSFTMPLYDKDWKELNEWRSKLKDPDQASNETKIVVLEKYPDSPLVPKKKEEK
jgi:hypothetical protein